MRYRVYASDNRINNGTVYTAVVVYMWYAVCSILRGMLKLLVYTALPTVQHSLQILRKG